MVRAAARCKHREMATSVVCTPSLWTIEQLKYISKREGASSGRKNELVKRVVDFQEAEALQAVLGAVAF